MLRLGLCCIFREQPISFRRATARYLLSKSRMAQLQYLANICHHNALALEAALIYCQEMGIGCFRINSQILPLKTHPQVGYDITDLPDGEAIVKQFRKCGRFSRKHNIRTTFHPDQFIVINSPKPDVVARSAADLVYHAEVAQWVNADVINIHGGGAYGDKREALKRLTKAVKKLPSPVRRRLTLENDDRTFTPADLLPVCRQTGVAFVYDIHHHRCLPDGMNHTEVTSAALTTWQREPLFHLSSPLSAWGDGDPKPHHDFINPNEFPCHWRNLNITVEIEAKAKEKAVLKLMKELPENLNQRCRGA